MAIGNFLTVTEAAEILRVSEIRVRQFFNRGRIPGRRAGQQIFLEADKVKEFSREERPPGRPATHKSPEKSAAKRGGKKSSRRRK